MAKKINPIFEGLPEDKTSTAIKTEPVVIKGNGMTAELTKRKMPIKKVTPKQDIKPEQINQAIIVFEEITFVSETTYKLNYIGIRRILMKAGKYIPALKPKPETTLETELQPIAPLESKPKNESLWMQYCNWWNDTFNKKKEINDKLEIVASDK